ncbi:MAG: hypothetical protein JW976_04295 [Syntrophaceae bacterium]|nr:hypothetical protein [Syntrophaceae bacterium]
MDVKFDIKKTFKVNGKVYSSVEEMPADIRKAYEQAMSNTKGIEGENIFSISSKIIFNGQEFDSVDSMPADVRQTYETIMKTVKNGEIPATVSTSLKIGEKKAEFGKEGLPCSYSTSKPIAPQSFLPTRVLIIAAAILGLVVGIYFIISLGGSH